MSDIVQKKNAPVEELGTKVTQLETKVEEAKTEKAKTDERIERLQAINASMQQMFDANQEKAKIESSTETNQL